MTEDAKICYKCESEMVRGFIWDITHGGMGQCTWVEGLPRKGFLGGVKPDHPASFWTGAYPEGAALPVATFRCPTCGFLESYAGEEFGPE